MNIGVFTDTFAPQINGVVTSIQTSIDYLENNHNVFVFCPNVKPKLPSTEKVWRFPSFVYPFQKEYRLVWPYNKRLKRIADLNLDILHIHTPFTMGYIGLRIGKKLNLPIIHTYHTYFEKYLHYFPILPEKWVYKYAKRESENFCNACHKIIVPTEAMRKSLTKFNIKKPIITIPSGINLYQPSEQDVSDFKNRYMKDGSLNCLFVGRIGVEKNIHFLIESFRLIKKTIPNVHLTIIGDGPERKQVEKNIKRFNLTNDITLTGYLNKKDVFSAYFAADLMLFPSKTETQGLTAVESIMSGTPVIGINEMGVKDVVNHNQSGILTNDNLTEYAEATISVLQDNSKRQKMSIKAKELGRAYSFEETGKKLESAYLDTIKNWV